MAFLRALEERKAGKTLAVCVGNQCGIPAPAVVLREAALASDPSNVFILWMLGQVGAGVVKQSCPCRTQSRRDNWDTHKLLPISWSPSIDAWSPSKLYFS